MTITIPPVIFCIVSYLVGILSGAWFSAGTEHNDDISKAGSIALFIFGLILLGFGVRCYEATNLY